MILGEEPCIGGRPRRGHATLHVEMVSGCSVATGVAAAEPLKLLVPVSRGQSVWASTSSFGGGMVAGDQTRLEIELNPVTRCFVGTQASTKVYRNPQRRPCSHATKAKVGDGALLVFAPDLVQAFAGSGYTQRQEFHLAPDASLVLLDWFSSGRTARGERWAFDYFESRNAVYICRAGREETRTLIPKFENGTPSSDELVFLDSIRLDADDEPLLAAHRTGRFNCFATLLMLGPMLGSRAANVLAELKQAPVRRQTALLASSSAIRDGVILRLAGETVEAVGRELQRHMAPLREHLGDDPWARKW